MYVCHTNQIGSPINSQSNFLLYRLIVCQKIWSRYSSERPYLLFYNRGGSNHILGLLRHFLWVRLRILVMDELSLEIWNSARASYIQKKRYILFLITKVTWYFCFSQGGNSIRGLISSLLVLRKCLRGDENILIWKSSNINNNSKCR